MTLLSFVITTSPRHGFGTLAAACRRLLKDLLHPYRPELHYMRGPGPKSREKRQRAAGRAA